MLIGGFRPPDDPQTSWFGTVKVAAVGEPWPLWNGKPMVGICQMNCSEMPHRPAALGDAEMVTLFIDLASDVPVDGTPNGEGWLLRTYPTLESLVLLDDPQYGSVLKPFPVKWEPIEEDLPAREDARPVLGAELDAIVDDYHEVIGGPAQGSKVGGWPFLIQSELFWAPFNRHPANPDYVLQIDSEQKVGLSWGDQGILYIGRGIGASSDTWTMTWQCL